MKFTDVAVSKGICDNCGAKALVLFFIGIDASFCSTECRDEWRARPERYYRGQTYAEYSTRKHPTKAVD